MKFIVDITPTDDGIDPLAIADAIFQTLLEASPESVIASVDGVDPDPDN